MKVSDCITISTLLRAHDIDAALIYDLTIEAIELERIRLDICRTNKDHIQYVTSLKKISQLQRLLSLIRIDALNGLRLGLWEQTIN